MKQIIIIFTILFIISGLTIFGQSVCESAMLQAKKDFKEYNYTLHSVEVLPVEQTYFYVLKNYFKIDWRFIDSEETSYYKCYDSVMIELLKRKIGFDFLEKTEFLSDSLESTKNWKTESLYPGGNVEMLRFIRNRIKIETGDLGESLQTKVYVQIDISETGKVENPIVVRGINNKIDKKIIKIFKNMPNWEPTYLYGKPIKQRYTIPINLEF